MAPENHIYLSDAEMEEVKLSAELQGKEVNVAASEAASKTIAHRFKRNTGKTPAKVYPIGRKKKDKEKS